MMPLVRSFNYMSMLNDVYPKEVVERCVQQSEPWNTKERRVRLSTALSLVLFVIGMALWSRRNQCQGWMSLVGTLCGLPPEPFAPGEQFLDFVELLDPLAPALPVGGP